MLSDFPFGARIAVSFASGDGGVFAIYTKNAFALPYQTSEHTKIPGSARDDSRHLTPRPHKGHRRWT
jgi:hypothetical protein